MVSRGRAVALLAALVVIALLTTASTLPRIPDVAVFATPAIGPQVVDVPSSPAISLSSKLFRSSSDAIVVTDSATGEDWKQISETAATKHVPVFAARPATSSGVEAELRRLGTRSVWVVGAGDTGLHATSQFSTTLVSTTHSDGLDRVRGNPAPGGRRPVVFATGPLDPDLAATAAAGGTRLVDVAVPDPRASGESVRALREARGTVPVIALGRAFGDTPTFARSVDEAVTVPEIPGGGQLVASGRRMVALYGSPAAPSLGPLGRQDIAATIARVKGIAAQYQRVSRELVVPAFEIIVTVASASPGDGGAYTSMIDPAQIRPWVEAAGRAGVYVTLDLQPGRMNFLTQAKRYADLLAIPHVGLALDPEWRLKPDQVHLTQIGSVGAAEVNATSDWLAGLTREHRLPQKLFVLHEFDTDMLANRRQIVTTRPELQTVIHADGHGIPSVKMDTWRRILVDLPPNVVMGWKNFYTEDTPMLTPAQTMNVEPSPFFVSFQ
ncbi:MULTISPECIES: hypothetical protein [Gordonia]|uniref:hypothetical protein n=1 Tax=Gordonia TaxID=2053 RepID=UPI00257A82B3|nr:MULTISPECIES: hypothetical protein [Gordonia]